MKPTHRIVNPRKTRYQHLLGVEITLGEVWGVDKHGITVYEFYVDGKKFMEGESSRVVDMGQIEPIIPPEEEDRIQYQHNPDGWEQLEDIWSPSVTV